MDIIIVGIPNNIFGTKVMIDSVKQVSKINDIPRKVAVHLSWINQFSGWIGLVVSYCKNQIIKFGPCSEISEDLQRRIQYMRTVLSNAANLIKNHVLMGNHIVGLLSSSYQGAHIVGGGKRKEITEKELKASNT